MYNDPTSLECLPLPLPWLCIISGVCKWKFHFGHSILSWFSGNEELFKERDQKDDEFLDRLKEFKIDSTDPQSEKVRKPNNEDWLTSSDVLFQSFQWPVETSNFNWWNLEFASLRAISARGGPRSRGKKEGGKTAWSQTNLQEIYLSHASGAPNKNTVKNHLNIA